MALQLRVSLLRPWKHLRNAAVITTISAPLHFSLPAGLDMVLLLYVSLLGSAASYGVFFYNASRGNLTALSSLTFLTPMFAAASG